MRARRRWRLSLPFTLLAFPFPSLPFSPPNRQTDNHTHNTIMYERTNEQANERTDARTDEGIHEQLNEPVEGGRERERRRGRERERERYREWRDG